MDFLVLLDNALLEGFAFALVPLACYLTFRVLEFPDVTVDGSFVLGGSVAALLITHAAFPPWCATLAALPLGAAAGMCTGLLYVRLGINKLLAGILVAFALYSVNLLTIGASLAFPGGATVLSPFSEIDRLVASQLPVGTLVHPTQLVFFAICFCAVKLGIDAYLASESGLLLRASPHCGELLCHKGISPERLQILGVAIANAVVALCGALIAQKEGAANSFRGTGIIIVGIAAYIVGEQIQRLAGSLCNRVSRSSRRGAARELLRGTLAALQGMRPTTSAALGAILYFAVVHIGYRLHLNPALPRLIMALVLVAFLGNWRQLFRTTRRGTS